MAVRLSTRLRQSSEDRLHDIAGRARQLTAGGAARLFADLHRDLHFADGRLTLVDIARANRASTGTAPGGLVLVPLVLGHRTC